MTHSVPIPTGPVTTLGPRRELEPRAALAAAEVMSTFGLKMRFLALGGGQVAYVDQGEGSTVLLLHGAPVTCLGFVRVVRELELHRRSRPARCRGC